LAITKFTDSGKFEPIIRSFRSNLNKESVGEEINVL